MINERVEIEDTVITHLKRHSITERKIHYSKVTSGLATKGYKNFHLFQTGY